MSLTPRAATLLGSCALAVLLIPAELAGLAILAIVVVALVDAWVVRGSLQIRRRVPRVVSRGVPSDFSITTGPTRAGRVRLRQATPADITIDVPEADGELRARITAQRRGLHTLPEVAARTDGPLGLGRWYHRGGGDHGVLVFPDLVSARRLALAVREGRFREPGRAPRGPLGLGTDFESIRDYSPDDDIRLVNWIATARLGKPMSNQYRLEQDRELICVIDSGRLMGAPLGEVTRLDVMVDAATAMVMVAEQMGDHCGLIAFDSRIRRRLSPRRRASRDFVESIFDLEPSSEDSDYELAFRHLENSKRAFVLVLTDLLEESAGRALIDAVPLLARRHHIVVASVTDTDLDALVTTEPTTAHDVYASGVALGVLGERTKVSARLRGAGAEVVEGKPGQLGAICVGAYLRAKARARS